MIYGSVCSGIEAATQAWHPLGWKASFYSEIDKFPRSVLAHHYPETPLHGDFTTIETGQYPNIDVLVGGTPCQSFSVAGLRKGLDDPRGDLMLGYGTIAKRLRPAWVVWENVPGVLSSNGGRDFGTFLGMLAELGYGFAYCVRDAQFFGVAQRRRRVFVVGYLGDFRRAAAVLFERHSLQGYPAPSREKGKAAPTIPSRRTAGGGLGTDFDCDGGLIAPPLTGNPYADHASREGLLHVPAVSPALKARDYKGPSSDGDGDGDGSPLIALGIPGNWIGRKPENGGNAVEPMHNLSPNLTSTDRHAVAFNARQDPDAWLDRTGPLDTKGNTQAIGWFEELTAHRDLAGTIQYGGQGGRHDGVMQPNMQVRRLTPRECERLQGFPDDYTLIPWRGKTAPDGPRYKALGNSMAVPVMAWIGRRIEMVGAIEAAA